MSEPKFNLSKSDIEFINKRWTDLKKRYETDNTKWEFHTKAEYAKEAIEITEMRIEAGILDIDKKDIAQYLINELPDISERTIYRVCTPEQKGNYFKSDIKAELKTSKWNVLHDDGLTRVEKDQFNNYRINGKEVSEKKEKSVILDVEKPKPFEPNTTTKTIMALKQCGSLIEKLAESFLDRYPNEEIDKVFKTKQLFYLDQYAILTNARKEVDKRDKWGDYEKILSKFLLETGETTSRLSALLNYSDKYGSIGIDRHDEFVDEQTKQFKRELLEFLLKCPSCKKNIFHEINENIERYRKGKELNIKLPL